MNVVSVPLVQRGPSMKKSRSAVILNITVCTEASVTRHIPLVEEILGEDANDVQKIDAAAAIILLLLESVKKQTFSLTYSAAAT